MILFYGLTCYAQDTSIKGIIFNRETNKPIPNAVITLNNSKNKRVYLARSENNGSFLFPISLLKKNKYLRIIIINYDPLELRQLSLRGNNLDSIKLTPSVPMLKEVVINANRRYRDTSKIDLSDKQFKRSVMVDDLLSDNQGFYKDSNGQLFYKDKLVKDLFINGSYFFGKNNMDILKYLPALSIDNIEIIETNIDSLTNATQASPTVTVNLKFKEKYNKGKLGNTNTGIGTIKRYLANAEIYSYKKNEQISLGFNINNINIGDNILQEPNIGFSTNGNDITSKSSKFTYRNLYKDKLEVNLYVKAKSEDKDFNSDSERKDELQNQFSKTTSSSTSRAKSLENTTLKLNYKISPLRTLIFIQNFDYRNNDQSEQLQYLITRDSIHTYNEINKTKTRTEKTVISEVAYEARSGMKKGRFVNINFGYNYRGLNTHEFNKVTDLVNQIPVDYYVDGRRLLKNNKLLAKFSFNEPVLIDGSAQLSASYTKDNIDYYSDIVSDTSGSFFDNPMQILNTYYRVGGVFQKVIGKITLSEEVSATINKRQTKELENEFSNTTIYPEVSLKIAFKIKKEKKLSLAYSIIPDYPDFSQTTNIGKTFDLVSQTSGNPNLKPQIRNTISAVFDLKNTGGSDISIGTSFERYKSKFGSTIINISNTLQNTYIDNIGSSFASHIFFSLNNKMKDGTPVNYSTNINYEETPTVTNEISYQNKNRSISQSISTSFALIKNFLTISPTTSASLYNYTYSGGKNNILSLSYSDKVSLYIGKLQLSVYPLINYSRNISNRFTWAINSDAKLNILNDFGTLFVRSYDIFNSFKFYNNLAGPNFTQTIKYSNLNSYTIIGVSIKFNNIK